MSNPIVVENQNTGTTTWQFSLLAITEIQAYADQTSLDPGGTINFYVSVQTAGHAYTISIYRLGWYGGTGGCLKATINNASGSAQGYWNQAGLAFVGMNPSIDATTHLFEAGWTSTDSWTVPANACTGIYIAKIVDNVNSREARVPFVVRGNATADYVYIRPDTTDAAYNDWGGWSLYTSPKAYKVSLNRPDRNYANCGGLYGYEMSLIHWLESQGYNLAYLSDVDVHATSGVLLTHSVVLYTCHDEYWTLEMRNAAETARAAGIGLAFLGANSCYWQMRFEADAGSHANRTVTCYKVAASGGLALATDPFYGVDNTRVTSQWRDPVLNRPENLLCGIMFSSNTVGDGTGNSPWVVDPAAPSKWLAGTGLVAGSSYGTNLVGYEVDKVFPNGPNNLQVIATSAFTNAQSQADTSNSTVYIGNGGALVFASGSISWTWALDSWRWIGQAGAGTTIPQMQSFMSNIMAALIRPKNPTGFSSFMAHV